MLATHHGTNHEWAARYTKLGLYLLTFSGIVFRSEIAILLAMYTAWMLLAQRASLLQTIIPAGLLGAAIGLTVTVGLDSFFWQKFPLWPEWTGFYYNTILGKSSEWGVSAWHYYLTNAIPKLLLNPVSLLICIPTALLIPQTRPRSIGLLLPNLAFVALFSILPHKEWRFIVYIVPAFTAVAAAGASWIWTRRTVSLLYSLLSLILVISTLASFAISTLLLGVSSLNYPGGEALVRLHASQRSAVPDGATVRVHLDNLSCQTGVTRFLQLPPPAISSIFDERDVHGARWMYDKSDGEERLLDPGFWAEFDYALAQDPKRVIGNWEVVDVVYGFDGVKILRPGDGSEGEEDIEIHMQDGRDVHAHVPPTAYQGKWYLQLMRLERLARPLTKGWWVRLKMVPKVWILKHQKDGKQPPVV